MRPHSQLANDLCNLPVFRKQVLGLVLTHAGIESEFGHSANTGNDLEDAERQKAINSAFIDKILLTPRPDYARFRAEFPEVTDPESAAKKAFSLRGGGFSLEGFRKYTWPGKGNCAEVITEDLLRAGIPIIDLRTAGFFTGTDDEIDFAKLFREAGKFRAAQ